MKKAYVFLAEGFEEIEAIAPIDLLKRAGVIVKTVSVGAMHQVNGAHGIGVVADECILGGEFFDADMIILPGGYPGYVNLAACKPLFEVIDHYFKNHKLIGAICASPAEVLGKNGYLKNYQAVCYPGMEAGLNCLPTPDCKVCVSDNIITSKSAGTAIDFALELVRSLCGDDEYKKLKESIVY